MKMILITKNIRTKKSAFALSGVQCKTTIGGTLIENDCDSGTLDWEFDASTPAGSFGKILV